MKIKDLRGLENPWLPPKITGGHIALSRSDRVFLQEMEEIRRERWRAKKAAAKAAKGR